MSQRYLHECLDKEDALTSPLLVRRYLQSRLRDRPQEVFAMLLLDNQHRVLQFAELFFGTIDAASVYPREIVRTVLKHNAAAVRITSYNVCYTKLLRAGAIRMRSAHFANSM